MCWTIFHVGRKNGHSHFKVGVLSHPRKGNTSDWGLINPSWAVKPTLWMIISLITTNMIFWNIFIITHTDPWEPQIWATRTSNSNNLVKPLVFQILEKINFPSLWTSNDSSQRGELSLVVEDKFSSLWHHHHHSNHSAELHMFFSLAQRFGSFIWTTDPWKPQYGDTQTSNLNNSVKPLIFCML